MISYYDDTIKTIKSALEKITILGYGSSKFDPRVDGYTSPTTSCEQYAETAKVIKLLARLPEHELNLLIGLYGDPSSREFCAHELAKHITNILVPCPNEAYDVMSMYLSVMVFDGVSYVREMNGKDYAEKHSMNYFVARNKKMKMFAKLNLWTEDALYKMDRALNGLYEIYTIY